MTNIIPLSTAARRRVEALRIECADAMRAKDWAHAWATRNRAARLAAHVGRMAGCPELAAVGDESWLDTCGGLTP